MRPSKSLFITATGTEVGKTVRSCAIARYCADRKQDVGVMKPIASGGREDAVRLKAASRVSDPLEQINPVLFKHPLAPYSASFIEKKSVDWRLIRKRFEWLRRAHGRVIVEGIGGSAVPLDAQRDVADLIKFLNLPALVVASAALGTLNHTLLTLRHLKSKRVRVAGVVLNHFDPRNLTHRTNLRCFERMRIPVLATFPFEKSYAKDAALAARRIGASPRLKKILI